MNKQVEFVLTSLNISVEIKSASYKWQADEAVEIFYQQKRPQMPDGWFNQQQQIWVTQILYQEPRTGTIAKVSHFYIFTAVPTVCMCTRTGIHTHGYSCMAPFSLVSTMYTLFGHVCINIQLLKATLSHFIVYVLNSTVLVSTVTFY